MPGKIDLGNGLSVTPIRAGVNGTVDGLTVTHPMAAQHLVNGTTCLHNDGLCFDFVPGDPDELLRADQVTRLGHCNLRMAISEGRAYVGA